MIIKCGKCSVCNQVSVYLRLPEEDRGTCRSCDPDTFDVWAEAQKELWLSGAPLEAVERGGL